MKLSDLTNRAGEWLRGSGPMREIVISSRIRLARNVAGYPFLSKCTRHQRQSVEAKVRETVLNARIADETLYVDLEAAPDLDRQLLVERHLISKPHATAEGARGVSSHTASIRSSGVNCSHSFASGDRSPLRITRLVTIEVRTVLFISKRIIT